MTTAKQVSNSHAEPYLSSGGGGGVGGVSVISQCVHAVLEV